jgi:hypothetical protein
VHVLAAQERPAGSVARSTVQALRLNAGVFHDRIIAALPAELTERSSEFGAVSADQAVGGLLVHSRSPSITTWGGSN